MANNYAEVADVETEFKNIEFSATTTPTDAQVDGFIVLAEASAHSYINGKYQVPTTGAEAVKVLRAIILDLVCGKIQNILAVKTGAPAVNQGVISVGDGRIKNGMAMLEKIRKGEIFLSDALLGKTDDGIRSFNVDNSSDNSTQPKFQRGKVMW